MATKFLEPGGDAGFLVGTTNGFWGALTNTPTISTDFVHGGHIKSIGLTGDNTGSQNMMTTKASVVSDAGARISFYLYIKTQSTSGSFAVFQLFNSGGTALVELQLTTGGVLQLFNSVGTPAQIGTNGATLSTGVWYRISLAYTITSTSVNRFELFVNGVSSISITNATLTTIVSNRVKFGSTRSTLSTDLRYSDFYIDDSSTLTDTGNIWVTAKRPFSNGGNSDFVTQVGSGGSGYGSDHAQQVNERPLSTTNGWSKIGAGSQTYETYYVETKSQGDIDISTASIIDWLGWVSIKSLVSETIQMILDGANTSQAITSTISLYTKIKGSTTYPSANGSDIGVATDTSLTTVSLYEAGVIVAYMPALTLSIFDSVTVSESVTTFVPTMTLTIFDSVTVSESLLYDPDKVYIRESVSLTVVSPVSNLSVSVFDSVTVSESVTIVLITNAPVINTFETVTVSESITISIPNLVPSIFETLTISENISLSISYKPSVFDLVTITESITRNIVSYISVNDSVTITENVSGNTTSSITISVNDTVTLSEGPGTTSTVSGPLSPGTMADAVGIGTVSWSNPDNAKVDDGAFATVTQVADYNSHYLKATNFGFAIPAGATINGILMEYDRKANVSGGGNFANDYVIKIVKSDGTFSSALGANGISINTLLPSTQAYNSYGGSSNLWAETWTPSDINSSNFGVGITITTNGGNVTVSVDHIRITVYYTVGGIPKLQVVSSPAPFESITVSEAIQISLSLPSPMSETVVVTDVPTIVIPTLAPSAFDSVTVSENVSLLGNNVVFFVNDTVTITENLQFLIVIPTSVFDLITLSENIALGIPLPISASDTVSISENALVVEVGMPSVNDTLTITENIQVMVVSYDSAFETVTITENVNLYIVTLYISTFDTVTISENISTKVITNESIFDLVTVSDVPAIFIPTLVPSVFDSVTISENLSDQEGISVSIFDLVTVSENVQIGTSAIILLVSDLVTVTDSPSEFITVLYLSGFDLVTVSESPVLSISSPSVLVSDSVTVSDVPSLYITGLYLAVNETVIISESLVLNGVSYISVFDSVTLSETSSGGVVTNLSVFDLVTATDQGGVSTSGLVGLWTFDEGTGTIAHDTSGSGNDGTLLGATLPTWVAGHIGSGALSFDGATSYVNVPVNNAYQFGTGDFAMSIWYYANNFNVRYHTTYDGGYIATTGVLLETDNVQQHIRLYLMGATALADWPFSHVIHTLYNLVITRTGNQLDCYANGVKLGTTVTNATSITKGIYLVGKYSGGELVNGQLDDFRIYNRALSPAEITSIYSNSSSLVTLMEISYPSISDSITVSENASFFLPLLLLSSFDNVTVSENTKFTGSEYAPLSELITVSESLVVFINNLVLSVSDLVTISENLHVNVGESTSIFELVTVSESITVFLPTLSFSVIDSVTVSESVSLTTNCIIDIHDFISITESIVLLIPTLVPQMSELVIMSEYINLSIKLPVSTFDLVTVSESVRLSIPVLFSVFDSVSISENISVKTVSNEQLFEIVSVTEDVTMRVRSQLYVFDAVISVDVPIFNVLSYVNVYDSVTISELFTETYIIFGPQIPIYRPRGYPGIGTGIASGGNNSKYDGYTVGGHPGVGTGLTTGGSGSKYTGYSRGGSPNSEIGYNYGGRL